MDEKIYSEKLLIAYIDADWASNLMIKNPYQETLSYLGELSLAGCQRNKPLQQTPLAMLNTVRA